MFGLVSALLVVGLAGYALGGWAGLRHARILDDERLADIEAVLVDTLADQEDAHRALRLNEAANGAAIAPLTTSGMRITKMLNRLRSWT